ncbi:MAG: winged helix-turn-helix domain-containing protein [Phycisphaerales bacterium]|nr:winged helix-turn-helix domain-containing protein [Phycisphaerales bacterium]
MGHPKPALGPAEYAVVAALIEAHPEPLTREQLERAAGPEAHRVLLALRKKDTSWSSAILIPSRSGRGGYRIL